MGIRLRKFFLFFLAIIFWGSFPNLARAQNLLNVALSADLDNDGISDISMVDVSVGVFDPAGTLIRVGSTDISGNVSFEGIIPGTYSVACLSCSDSTFSPQFARFIDADPVVVQFGGGSQSVALTVKPPDLAGFRAAIQAGEIRGAGWFPRTVWAKATKPNKENPEFKRVDIARALLQIRDHTFTFAQDFTGSDEENINQAHAILTMHDGCDPNDQDLDHCPLPKRLRAQFLATLLSKLRDPIVEKDPPEPIGEVPPEQKPATPSFSSGIFIKATDFMAANTARFTDEELRLAVRANRSLLRNLAPLPQVRPDLVLTLTPETANPQVGISYFIQATTTNFGDAETPEQSSVLLRLDSGQRVDSPGDNCSLLFPDSNQWVCLVPPLEPGRSHVVTFNVTSTAAGPQTDRAVVAGSDPNWNNNVASTTVTAERAESGIRVTLPDVPASVAAPSETVISVRVENNSSVDATGGMVRISLAALPVGAATVTSVSAPDGEVVEVREDFVRVSLNPVRPAQTATVNTTVSAAAPGSFDYRAEVEFANFEPVRTEANVRITPPLSPPTVTSPPNNSTVSGRVTVSYEAPPEAVRAEFSVDDVRMEVQEPPTGSFTWESTTVPDGDHTLTVRVFDSSGREAATTITVTVANDTEPVRITVLEVPPTVTDGDLVPIRMAVENTTDREIVGTYTVSVSAAENIGRFLFIPPFTQDGEAVDNCSFSASGITCSLSYAPQSISEIMFQVGVTLSDRGQFGNLALQNDSTGTDHSASTTIDFQVVPRPPAPVCGDQVCDVNGGECSTCPEDCTLGECGP